MSLNDKEFAIDFLTMNLITLPTSWGKFFAVFQGFTKQLQKKVLQNTFPSKVRRIAESVSLNFTGFYK